MDMRSDNASHTANPSHPAHPAARNSFNPVEASFRDTGGAGGKEGNGGHLNGSSWVGGGVSSNGTHYDPNGLGFHNDPYYDPNDPRNDPCSFGVRSSMNGHHSDPWRGESITLLEDGRDDSNAFMKKSVQVRGALSMLITPTLALTPTITLTLLP